MRRSLPIILSTNQRVLLPVDYICTSLMYLYCARKYNSLDYSNDALYEAYLYETKGIQTSNPKNAYVIGKRDLNLNIQMWREDIKKGYLLKEELYGGVFSNKYLDKVLK